MLLSIDWDAYSGCRELVFDAPIWGSPDREEDRTQRWRERAVKRGGWEALSEDYPLYDGWQALEAYAGRPTFSAWNHAHAWEWLTLFPAQDVLNVDSHHDLYSQSGDPSRLRPGNWAGLALESGRIRRYAARYPTWHAGLPVSEGYDLARTRAELTGHCGAWLPRVQLERSGELPPVSEVKALLLVQSPSWTNPAHDEAWLSLLKCLRAQALSPSYDRRTLLLG